MKIKKLGDILLDMESRNLVKMFKIINFRHFEHISPLSPSWRLPKANSKLTACGQRNRQQATGNRQQATGNRQQATGNRQLYTSSYRPSQRTNSRFPPKFNFFTKNHFFRVSTAPGFRAYRNTGFLFLWSRKSGKEF